MSEAINLNPDGPKGLTFSVALEAMKEGRHIARKGWSGFGMWISIQKPDEASKMRKPYVYLKTTLGEFVPWTPSHSDMLASDWYLVEI